MLRQIARLGRPVPSAGARAVAIAVYGDVRDEPVVAREAGFEGVACVDDAARALELYCDVWDATHLPWVMSWCKGLLDFILAMQDGDGRWVNFILDWNGTPNRQGRTSQAGGDWWQARAILALARASRTMSDARVAGAIERGMFHVVSAAEVPSDVRALHVMAALLLLDTPDGARLRDHVAAWADEILRCRDGDVLTNSTQERGHPHLWGHVQEGVLATAGALLKREDMVDVARRSADLVFGELIRSGFDAPRMQPYDVASAVYVMSRLAQVTGSPAHAAGAADSRAWFDGRNPAGVPVYDRGAGRVADGIDGAKVNLHSGAESNIVGAQALLHDAIDLARRVAPSEVLPAGLDTPALR